MDLNQSIEFRHTSTNATSQMHTLMHLQTPLSLNNNQDEDRHSHFKNLLRQNIIAFWEKQMLEIQNASDAKSQYQLPLARIKKIVKSNEEVKMISANTPVLFAKACEMFILELTLRAWLLTEENRRRTLQRCDIARAIRNEELLDFLVDIVPLQSHQEDMTAHSEVIDHHPAFPINLHNLNPAFFMSNQEIPQYHMFTPSMRSVRPKYDPGFK